MTLDAHANVPSGRRRSGRQKPSRVKGQKRAGEESDTGDDDRTGWPQDECVYPSTYSTNVAVYCVGAAQSLGLVKLGQNCVLTGVDDTVLATKGHQRAVDRK